VHSSNGGKSLIRRHDATVERSFGEFFDSKGTLDRSAFDNLLSKLWKDAAGEER
jgi:hypothetical protein